jgi:hypothetical protein
VMEAGDVLLHPLDKNTAISSSDVVYIPDARENL